MSTNRQHRHTHLFTVRLWIEPGASFGAEVRGRVQHVLSGEVIYFRTWTDLLAFFDAVMEEVESTTINTGDDQALS